MAKTPKWRKVVAYYHKSKHKNKTKTAQKFGIDRSTVYSYLRLAEKQNK